MSETKYLFTRKGLTDISWKVTEGGTEIAEITVKDDTIIATPKSCDLFGNELNERLTEIEKEFMAFVVRPEFIIGTMIPQEALTDEPINSTRQQELIEYLEQYIKGCCAIIYSDELSEKYAQRAISWLETTDFYTAPASTKYHDSDASGLLRHTLKVINNVTELSHMSQFKDVDLAEAILAAIVHDWCKINFYEEYYRNVKDDETGKWEKVPAYRCKDSDLPFGHGVTSLFIAQKIFKLSVEQALAVRWHMSLSDVSEYEKYDLYVANARYPMVMLLQIADQLSAL